MLEELRPDLKELWRSWRGSSRAGRGFTLLQPLQRKSTCSCGERRAGAMQARRRRSSPIFESSGRPCCRWERRHLAGMSGGIGGTPATIAARKEGRAFGPMSRECRRDASAPRDSTRTWNSGTEVGSRIRRAADRPAQRAGRIKPRAERSDALGKKVVTSERPARAREGGGRFSRPFRPQGCATCLPRASLRSALGWILPARWAG